MISIYTNKIPKLLKVKSFEYSSGKSSDILVWNTLHLLRILLHHGRSQTLCVCVNGGHLLTTEAADACSCEATTTQRQRTRFATLMSVLHYAYHGWL